MKHKLIIICIILAVFTITPANAVVKTPNLAGGWRFEGNANDFSGNGNNGTVTGAVLATGKFGQCYSFNSASYILCGSGSTLAITTELTLSAWIYINATGNHFTILNRGNYSSGDGYLFYKFNTEKLAFYSSGAFSWAQSTGTVGSLGWHHVAVTFSSADSKTLRFYIDGVASGTATSASDLSSYAGNFEIGADEAYYLFNGSIDEVRVYNRALNAAEIGRLYGQYKPKYQVSNLNKGLVGKWALDSTHRKSSTVFTDSTPYSNNGTSANTPSFTTDRHGQSNKAMSFNGTTDYVSGSDNSSFNFTSSFTIGAWIKASNVTGYKDIFNKNSGSNGIEFYISGSTLKAWVMGTTFTGGGTIQTDTWTHVTLSYTVNLGTGAKFYVNGIQVGSSEGTPATYSNPAVNFRIGVYQDAAQQFFNGSISDVRIYNRALTATEIMQLYNSY
ncbi:MAG: Glycoside hydrolase family 2 sugar binding protein [Candidatus Berkelbacteria bacterium Licking1014_7]|uniref:Glycoside hydrolase family 2 sugar binding protein n=1 Tax=Candidatus Berkelbacteria bacterium Licking1014_7 TaxID=2017147 RepID=A0A554LI18_9BACT|nr:MAG: Glycoside hydrolase family 2 sugar binding protein [Candidatus Berkelbacteria bacterium Licking1014_7]